MAAAREDPDPDPLTPIWNAAREAGGAWCGGRYDPFMLFMVVERFRGGDPRPVYERTARSGRMLPDGLRYVDSWVEASLGRCFQLMECDDLTLLTAWIAHWSDLVEFEVAPVVTSNQAAAAVQAPHP